MTAQPPELNREDWLEIEREYCRRSLVHFAERAWRVLEPESPFVYGDVIGAVAEHLEAVTNGELTRLMITVPPGMMKSLMTGVIWPAWEWGPVGKPTHRFIGGSHEVGLSTRDNMRMRRLVSSEWFQELWPTPLSKDQNAKIKFENEAQGFRQACSVKSMTGNRAHRVVWDDPLSAEGAESEAERTTVLRELQETVPTRMTSPERSAIVIIMQRLHQHDPVGFILENDLGYEHLNLPMEFEPDNKCVTSIGFKDWRTEPGELLFPERFPRHVVDRDKSAMTDYAVAGQFQQRPAPRGGGMFPVEKFGYMDSAPSQQEILASIRYWDKAGTEGGGANTAGVLMHRLKSGSYVIEDVVRGQWGAQKREARIRATAEQDGHRVAVWVEQEPGSGGKESAENTVKNLAGYRAYSERVTGDKVTRADPYAAQVQGGNVWLVRGEWNAKFTQEHETFPAGNRKDQVDAAAGAFAKLAKAPANTGAML